LQNRQDKGPDTLACPRCTGRRLARRVPSTGPHDAALGWSGVEFPPYALARGSGGGARSAEESGVNARRLVRGVFLGRERDDQQMFAVWTPGHDPACVLFDEPHRVRHGRSAGRAQDVPHYVVHERLYPPYKGYDSSDVLGRTLDPATGASLGSPRPTIPRPRHLDVEQPPTRQA
jgi:hypothetical protein